MKKGIWILALIFGLALILRLVILNQSLWLDEAIGAVVAKTLSFRSILLKFPLSDNHPPLYYLILKAWTFIFGFSEVSLRLPSVIFGILTILFVYKIAKKFTKINPIIPTILLATSPLHIYYSQEARMYSLAAFLTTATIYFFLKTFQSTDEKSDWIFFSIFYTLLAFSDYVPIFLYPVFILYPIFKNGNWVWWKKFVISNIPLFILGILWLPIFRIQGANGKFLLQTLPAWRDIAGGATFKELGVFWSKFVLGRITFFNKFLYYSLIFLASIPVIALIFISSKNWKENKIFWLWLIVPIVLCFAISLTFPAFIYFRFIFVLPAFYFIIALGGNKNLIYLVILFNLIGWGIYVFDGSQHREDWRAATLYVENSAGPKDIAIFENPEPFAPYRWYWDGKIPSFGATDSISAKKAKTEKITESLIKDKNGVYYFEYLKDLQDPLGIVPNTLLANGFVEINRKAFKGVGFVIYYQDKGHLALEAHR